MLDELKSLFPEHGLAAVTELLKVSGQLVAFLEQHLKDADKINAAIDHFKTMLDEHKKPL